MLPDAAHPERGNFVRDQVAALEGLDGLDVELFEFPPGARALARAAADLRRLPRFDVVHAHFGLTFWPALSVRADLRALTLHGTDLAHPRTRLATLAGLPLVDVLGTVSQPLVAALPAWARARARVLPCGADLKRFAAISREDSRRELGLQSSRPYLLFPADPARAEKRYDRALELARSARAELLTLGGVDPQRVPLWVNAANAAVVPSDREVLRRSRRLHATFPCSRRPSASTQSCSWGSRGRFARPMTSSGGARRWRRTCVRRTRASAVASELAPIRQRRWQSASRGHGTRAETAVDSMIFRGRANCVLS